MARRRGRARGSFKLLLTALAFASACTPRPTRWAESSPDELIAWHLSRVQDGARSSGIALAAIDGPEGFVKARLYFASAGESRLFAEAVTPSDQSLALLVLNEARLLVWDARSGRCRVGPACPEALVGLVGVPLAPEELVAALSGRLPDLGSLGRMTHHVQQDPPRHVYRFLAGEGGPSVEVQLSPDGRDLLSLRSEAGGRVLLDLRYGGHRSWPLGRRQAAEVEVHQRAAGRKIVFRILELEELPRGRQPFALTCPRRSLPVPMPCRQEATQP